MLSHKNLVLTLFIFLSFFSFFSFFSCAGNAQSDIEQLDKNENEDDSENFDDDDEEDELSEGGNQLKFPVPKEPTAFYTRVFVKTQKQPSETQIATCFAQFSELAKNAENPQALLSAQNEAANIVSSDLLMYHYCFYQMMASLDERLDQGGPMMDDLASAFFEGMRRLWIFARAMDVNIGRSTYFDWLTKRYIQISSDYFGRSVQVIASPMSAIRDDLGGYKKAGSFPGP